MAFILKFDGVTMPCPAKYDFSIQDVSAGESGRTDDGVMHKNRVAQKRKIALSWVVKTPQETARILSAAQPEYIDIYSKESDIIIFDAPQLFESGGDKICDNHINATFWG